MDGAPKVKHFIDESLIERLRFDESDRGGQERARRSRAQIIEAALDTFMEVGFEGVSTHEIADRAEITQGLITYHFKTKDGLWQACMDRLFGDFRNQLARRIVELNDIDDPIFFKLIIRHIVRWPSQYPFMVKFMTGTGSADPAKLNWLIERHIRDVFEVVCAILDAGKAHGIFRDLPNLNVYFLLMTASSVYSLKNEIAILRGVDVYSPEFVEQQADTIIRMLSKSAE